MAWAGQTPGGFRVVLDLSLLLSLHQGKESKCELSRRKVMFYELLFTFLSWHKKVTKKVKKEKIYSPFLSFALIELLYYCGFGFLALMLNSIFAININLPDLYRSLFKQTKTIFEARCVAWAGQTPGGFRVVLFASVVADQQTTCRSGDLQGIDAFLLNKISVSVLCIDWFYFIIITKWEKHSLFKGCLFIFLTSQKPSIKI